MANLIPNNWIEKVKDSSDIVSVISSYIPLKQQGRTFWGNCPFHHETEPSFAVNPIEQYFHCFGCGVGGNVFSFVSKIESLSFFDAVKLLAEKNRIELPESIDDKKMKERLKEKNEYLQINLLTARFYNSTIMSDKGVNAKKYLYNRGLSDNIITRFGIGYSPDFKSLCDYLKLNNISLEMAHKAGVLGKKNENYYDFFAERIVFPIINTRNEVVGFSARAITKEYYGGKYKNSPDSIVFNKSNIVYGINNLKKAMQTHSIEYAIIVEGQMDVISLHQVGFDTAVACMGTALTPYHAKEIKRFVGKVIVCFDGDSAGQKATFRSLEILEQAGLNVFVLSLPDNMDPDEFIKKHSSKAFEKLIAEAKSKNDYLFEVITGKYNLEDNNQKANYVKEILEMIDNLKTNSEKEIYLNAVNLKTKIPVTVLKQDLVNGTKITETIYEKAKETKGSTAYEKALEFVFASILHRKEYVKSLDFQIMNSTYYSNLLEYLKDFDYFDDTIFDDIELKLGDTNLEKLKTFDFTLIAEKEKYYDDCIKIIKLEELTFEKNIYNEKLVTATDSDSRVDILKKINEILNKIRNLKTEE